MRPLSLRVLLDENVDRRLKRVFDEQHEISTVPERDCAGKKNGELLEAAGKEFDPFVTTDRSHFTCKKWKKRKGWDSNPRDDLTPPTRFPISKGHLTSFVRGVLIYSIASV